MIAEAKSYRDVICILPAPTVPALSEALLCCTYFLGKDFIARIRSSKCCYVRSQTINPISAIA